MIFSHVLYQLSYLGSLTPRILHYLVFFVKHWGSGRRKKRRGHGAPRLSFHVSCS